MKEELITLVVKELRKGRNRKKIYKKCANKVVSTGKKQND